MSFQEVRANSCPKCGGKQWIYMDYCRTENEQILEERCLNIHCGHQFLRYGDEVHVFNKTPEEMKEFIEDYSLEDELEEELVS
tara:strand:- start:109 stop:357 length:249 start_codon:yes stop_codon:yes gene_type:complete